MEKTSQDQVQDMNRYIKDANFPCDRDTLERSARDNDAPRDVIDRIRQLPQRQYQNVDDIDWSKTRGVEQTAPGRR